MGSKSWLVAGTVPGVERQPLKRLEPDASAVLRLIERWRGEAIKAGRTISRMVLAYEVARDYRSCEPASVKTKHELMGDVGRFKTPRNIRGAPSRSPRSESGRSRHP